MNNVATEVLKTNNSCGTIVATKEQSSIQTLSAAELKQLERTMIPFLNMIRALQGKQPVILPGEKRTG